MTLLQEIQNIEWFNLSNKVKSILNKVNIRITNIEDTLPKVADNFANDVAAAIGGIEIGQLYHTNGAIKIRRT